MLDVIPSCLNTISLLHISPFSLKYKQIKKSVYACVDVCVFLMSFKTDQPHRVDLKKHHTRFTA